MEELLKEVFIKEVNDTGIDMVFYVTNLPKRFIYTKVPKMVQRYDRDGYTDGTLIPSPTGEKVDGLLDGLEYSLNGDGAIIFNKGRESSREALKAIDAYIAGTLPRDAVIPTRVDYPQDRTDPRSAPKFRGQIPTVELPAPQFKREEPQVSLAASAVPAKASRHFTEEQKQAARERLALAREKKKQMLAESKPQE